MTRVHSAQETFIDNTRVGGRKDTRDPMRFDMNLRMVLNEDKNEELSRT